MSALDDALIEIVRSSDADKGVTSMWESLIKYFEGRERQDMRAVRQELMNLKMTGSMSLTTYLDRIELLHTRLKGGNAKLDDEDKLVILTNGLHQRYDQFILIMDTLPTVGYDDYVSKLTQFHRRHFHEKPTSQVGW